MATTDIHKKQTSIYWRLLRNLSDEVKIGLISLLSKSLRKKPAEASDTTDLFLEKFYGKWKGNASADEVISAIYETRSSRDPMSFE